MEGVWRMGNYLNPSSQSFKNAIQSKIYVDKSMLIELISEVINTEQRFVCVSRPRRFGKSMAANMLAAYYTCVEDTHPLFTDLKISQCSSYRDHINQYNVIKINMQDFLSMTHSVDDMVSLLQKIILRELRAAYPNAKIDEEYFLLAMDDLYAFTKRQFVILIDEWDCLFREFQDDVEAQRKYLDFLRGWLKDKSYVALAYMTGILPVKKYGTHSALNMFWEYSMSAPGELAPFFGFTEDEVIALCDQYNMSFEETKAWYDGYVFSERIDGQDVQISMYSPKSVVEAMLRQKFGTYWNQTETYEALKLYIDMNFDGLKDAIVKMLAGGQEQIDINGFENDMTNLSCADDVLTLLIHLGYLTYDEANQCVSIPNKEVSAEYVTSIKRTAGWSEVANSVEASRRLLESLWDLNADAVAAGVQKVHQEVSILQYNDENALSYTINLAFYFAKEYYTIFRELSTGKGFADICFVPRTLHADKPAVVIELKWDKSTGGAIDQIKNKQYVDALKEFKGNLLLVGINYDRKTKEHSCEIERLQY